MERITGLVFSNDQDQTNNKNEEKKPIMLTISMIIDILLLGLSFSRVLLYAMNSPNFDKFEDREVKIGQDIFNVMVIGFVAEIFTLIFSMLILSYSVTILFGNKIQWLCFPWLMTEIKKELHIKDQDSPPNGSDKV